MESSLRTLLDRLPAPARLRALTHPAWARTHPESYERLEFLGDSVLGLAIAAELQERFPDLAEGELSRIKNAVVSRSDCAEVGLEAGLGTAMAQAAPPHADPALVAELSRHDRVIAALVESVIGAAFVEFGYDEVAPVIVDAFGEHMAFAADNRHDAKGVLQEHAQRDGQRVEYEVTGSEGPPHDPRFTVEARLSDTGETARGTGRSKKLAEQAAARALLAQLDAISGPGQ
jgi:ribonuclease-3